MSKQAFHQDLIGRRVVENPDYAPQHRAGSAISTFKHYGLEGEAVEIIGAWIVEGSVKVLVRDFPGHTAEIYLSTFLVKEGKTK